jgi:hypothetical protein
MSVRKPVDIMARELVIRSLGHSFVIQNSSFFIYRSGNV